MADQIIDELKSASASHPEDAFWEAIGKTILAMEEREKKLGIKKPSEMPPKKLTFIKNE